MGNTYLRFFRLMSAIDNPAFPTLDDTSRKILEVVSAEAFLSNRYLTVKQLIEMDALGSKANLHSRLHGLVESGYIKLVPQTDARFKDIVPTAKSKKYFEVLSKTLEKSIQG
jgi:hypothetical protein